MIAGRIIPAGRQRFISAPNLNVKRWKNRLALLDRDNLTNSPVISKRDTLAELCSAGAGSTPNLLPPAAGRA